MVPYLCGRSELLQAQIRFGTGVAVAIDAIRGQQRVDRIGETLIQIIGNHRRWCQQQQDRERPP